MITRIDNINDMNSYEDLMPHAYNLMKSKNEFVFTVIAAGKYKRIDDFKNIEQYNLVQKSYAKNSGRIFEELNAQMDISRFENMKNLALDAAAAFTAQRATINITVRTILKIFQNELIYNLLQASQEDMNRK